MFAVLVAGCATDKPAGARFASVEIPDATANQIASAAKLVFEQNGYRTISNYPDKMVFERDTTRSEQVAYGGWLDSEKLKVRVRAEMVRLPTGVRRLQCQAFMAITPDREEDRLSNMRNDEYQRLMDLVAARVRQQQSAPNP